MLPSKSNHMLSPFQLLHNSPPTYNHLRTFGCQCYPWLRPYKPNKLTLMSNNCIFIWYTQAQKGYRCYDLSTEKIYSSKHVIFDEDTFPYQPQAYILQICLQMQYILPICWYQSQHYSLILHPKKTTT